ncbi:hypothetical protein EB796_002311 [Bugula neritina]|uniref:Tetratricopeptide repeat protein 7 N-terminal domain-containing protein n=1 Tax=Bugula neritina TaxID=10212 RepID=A0A7J7KMJ4_BUGNE|nr:hypothetical protein EB796_002311 [Bugula neritina]
MANKGKNYKIEAEIEKYRAHQNWDKALEVTKNQWSNSKSANGLADLNDVVSNLLHGEKELESYLRANPPSEENVGKAKESLASAEKHLRYVSTRCPKEKETLKREAVLLLVKLLFAQARYTDALNEFESISVDALTIHSITNRMLKILAEGLAVKAMCMEKLIDQGVRERTPQAEEMIIKYYEQAGDILLVYLQNRDVVDLNSASPTYSGNVAIGSGSHNTTSDDSIGSILEMAVQKSPLIYIEKGEVSKGVGRFRDLLRAVGSTTSKNLYRLTLARQLAEVLLRGVCSATYPPIALKTDRKRGSLKARQYKAMANREAVLERRPEHKQSRQHSYDNATAVYDLLAIALVRRSNCAILAEALERAMKFSYEEPTSGTSLLCHS